jgi:hypothetical protein
MTLSFRWAHADLGKLLAHALPRALTLLVLAILLALLASTYFGDSFSPYGTCYAPSGRAVPCAALAPRR